MDMTIKQTLILPYIIKDSDLIHQLFFCYHLKNITISHNLSAKYSWWKSVDFSIMWLTNVIQQGFFSSSTGMFWQPAISLVVIMEQHKLDLVFFTPLQCWQRWGTPTNNASWGMFAGYLMVNILQTWIETRLHIS